MRLYLVYSVQYSTELFCYSLHTVCLLLLSNSEAFYSLYSLHFVYADFDICLVDVCEKKRILVYRDCSLSLYTGSNDLFGPKIA